MKETLRRKLFFQKLFVVFIGCFFLLPGKTLKAQVAGVSGSKLTAADATLVPFHTLEAEPSFVYLFSRKAFNNDGKLVDIFPNPDTAVLLKDLFFRFTYGTGKHLEIGTEFTSSLSAFSFGAKYRFIEHKKFLAAALLGFNFSNQANFGVRKTGFFGKSLAVVGGIALTENFTPRLSLDVECQYQNTFCYDGSLSDNYFFDSDVGYYVFHHTLQLAGGLSFQYHHLKEEDGQDGYLLSFHPGVTIETGKSFIIVFYMPIDLVGRNQGRFYGFSFAFTFAVQ